MLKPVYKEPDTPLQANSMSCFFFFKQICTEKKRKTENKKTTRMTCSTIQPPYPVGRRPGLALQAAEALLLRMTWVKCWVPFVFQCMSYKILHFLKYIYSLHK